MADLFVSYSRADADIVRRLCEALAATKREVWVDWRDIPPTAAWREQIRSAIDAASAVLFVLSPAWTESKECRQEFDLAAARGKRLIPVVVQKPDVAAVPPALVELNWIFLHAEALDAGVRLLVQALDTDLAWARAHAELLRRATAWQSAERDPGKLLRGRDLAEAERWLATDTTAPKPVAVQSAFVLASRTAAVRGQRMRVALAIGVAIVALGLSVWAFLERRIAERRYQESLSRQLTIEANRVREEQPDRVVLSVQLAAEAMRRVPSQEAAEALRAGLRLLPRLLWQAPAPTATGTAIAFTPDGARIATADAVWDVATGAPAIAFAHEGRTTHVAFGVDGRHVARLGGGRLQLHDRSSGRPIALQAPERHVPLIALAFSRDGGRLAAADQRSTVHVWDTGGGTLLRSLAPPETLSGSVRGIAFHPEGGVIAVARRQRIERWEMSTWQRLEPALTLEAGAVAAIDYATDGRLAAVTGSGAVVVHARDGAPAASFRVDEALGRVEAMRFAPDDRHLAIAAADGVQIVDASDGGSVLLTRLGGSFAFAPDSARLAVAGAGRTAHVLAIASGEELARMVHGAGVGALAFGPDGTTLATLSDDGALRLWESRAAFPSARLRGELGAFVDGGRHVVATGEGQAASLWSRATQRVLQLPEAGAPRQTVLAADGSRLASVVGDVVLAWPLPALGQPTRMAHAPPIDWQAMRRRDVEERGGALRVVSAMHAMLREVGSVEIAAASPDAASVLTTRIDEIARLWDARLGRLVAEVPAGAKSEAGFSGDGMRVAFSTAHGIEVRDARSGLALARIAVEGVPRRVLLDHDGRRLAVLLADGASLFDVDGARPVGAFAGASEMQRAPDARSFAVAGDSTLRWIEASTGQVLAEVACQCRIAGTVFGGGGRIVAVVADDNLVRVRTRAQGGGDRRDIAHGGVIGHVAISADGRLLALTGSDPLLVETAASPGQPRATGHGEPWQRLVEIETGREIALEQERAEDAIPVFSTDGRFLAAGAVVWDTVSGRRLARAEGRIVAFSPDGRLLLTRRDDVIQVWPWRDEDMLALACRQLPRNLPAEDWQRHVSRDEPPAKTCPALR